MVISTLRILTAAKSRAEVVRILAAQLGSTRLQPGCLRCDLYQDIRPAVGEVMPPDPDKQRLQAQFPAVTFKGFWRPVIGPGANISDGALLDCAATITIGKHAFVGYRVMILTGSHAYHGTFGEARKRAISARPVTIGEGVWICSGAIICPGVTIGEHAVVGPGAVVMRNVAPYTVVAGNPARFVRRLRSKHGTQTA